MYGARGLTYLLGEEENGRPPTLTPLVIEYESAHAEGARLRGHIWLPADGTKVKSVVLACHGYNHYIGNALYTRLASELCAEGVAVLGLTLEGHGRSGGVLAWVRDFESLVLQELEFYDVCCGVPGSPPADVISTRGKRLAAGSSVLPVMSGDVPVVLVGESMGGAVAIDCCQARPRDFAGVVLIAPMCGIEARVLPHPCLIAVGELVARCFPTAPITPMTDTLPLGFRDPGKLPIVLLDSIRYPGRTRIGTGICLRNASIRIAATASKFSAPLLMFHGTADVMTSPVASRRFFEDCSSSDKTYIEVPGARHSLWWEPLPNRQAMLSDITRFVLSRSAGFAATARGAPGAVAPAASAPGAVAPAASAVLSYPERTGPYLVSAGKPFSTKPATVPPSDWPGFDKAPGAALPGAPAAKTEVDSEAAALLA
jgi:alpha-beta hydrolase superfamily lysophospholipase